MNILCMFKCIIISVGWHWGKQRNIQLFYFGKLWCFTMQTVSIAYIENFSQLLQWFSQNLLNYMSAELKKGGFFIINWHSFLAGMCRQVFQTNLGLPKTQLRTESFGNALNLYNITERKCNIKLIKIYIFNVIHSSSFFYLETYIKTNSSKQKHFQKPFPIKYVGFTCLCIFISLTVPFLYCVHIRYHRTDPYLCAFIYAQDCI